MSETPLPVWHGVPAPTHVVVEGRYIDLEPLNVAKHGDDLWECLSVGPDKMWAYMFYGPFSEKSSFLEWLQSIEPSKDPLFFVVIDKRTRKALGQLTLMRIEPAHGVVEIGHVLFSPALQRTRMSTEAIFLLMQKIFDAKYRRLEWKCNDANAPSHAAARRFGFAHEGTFRKHIVAKGLNRDTAWYALLDDEWPVVREELERWLDANNFDKDGRMIAGLKAREAAEAVRGKGAEAS